MKKLFFKLFMIALLCSPFMALASEGGGSGDGGGMVNRPDLSYIIVEPGECVTLAVAGVDLEKCSISPASPQSGLEAWICPPPIDENGDEIVICNPAATDEDSEDEGD